MSKIDQTNEPFEEYGGVLHLNNYEQYKFVTDHVKKLEVQLQYEFAKLKNPPDVKLRIVLNEDVNGVATKHNGGYYIGIYLGTAHTMYSVFFRMLACKHVLPNLGDPSREIDIVKVDDIRYPNFELMAKLTGNVIAPIGDERALLAVELFTIVLKYLVYHEAGHILFGHVDYTAAAFGMHAYEEKLGSDESQIVGQKFRQACELDADAFAINRSMTWLKKLWEHSDPRMQSIFSGVENSVFIWTFAVYTFWKVNGGELDRVIVAHYETHPSPETRQHMLWNQIGLYFDNYYAGQPNQHELVRLVLAAVMRGAHESELAFAAVSNVEYNAMPNMFLKEIRQYMRDMTPEMSKARKMVEPFSILQYPK